MSENSRRPSRGPMGRGRMNGEKAKDFSGAVKKLLRYMSKYKDSSDWHDDFRHCRYGI